MDYTARVLNYYTAAMMLLHLMACLSERSYRQKRIRLFINMMILDIVILLSEAFVSKLLEDYQADGLLWAKLVSCVLHISYYGLLAVFCTYSATLIQDTTGVKVKRNPLLYAVCAASAALWCISGWTGWVIQLEPGGISRGPLYLLGQCGGWVIGGYIIYKIFYYRAELGKRNAFFLLSFPLFPVLASLVRLFLPSYSFMALALSASILLLYNFIFWRQRHLLEQQKLRIAEEQMAVTLSQIGPHFIYNVLNSIYYLCKKDPAQAQIAVAEFAEYLRGNLSGVEQKKLIPASQELDHVRHYLNLEKMRFGGELRVEMDIGTEDFSIPPLSLQPLVENAVKHGIMKRKGGGTVRLSTCPVSDGTLIQVEDDGVGFDPEKLSEDDGVHIGIRNVRWRLQNMCGASMKVESRIGEGTTVSIVIPDRPGTVQEEVKRYAISGGR